MKKLLVLMLVLCMASAASALSLSITADTSDPFAIVSGGLDQDLYLALLGDGPLTYTLNKPPSPSLSDIAGTQQTMIDYGLGALVPAGFTGNLYILATAPATPPEEYVDGDYLRADGAAGDQVYACWFDEGGNFGVIGTVTLVPEPMTIALMGLGSLILLRRRK